MLFKAFTEAKAEPTGLRTYFMNRKRSHCVTGQAAQWLTDAITDFDEESSRHSLEKIFPMISEREQTASILSRLSQ